MSSCSSGDAVTVCRAAIAVAAATIAITAAVAHAATPAPTTTAKGYFMKFSKSIFELYSAN